MHGNLLLLSLDSMLPQVRTRNVTIGASSILNFIALSSTLFMTIGAYTLPSHPIKALLTVQHQDLQTTCKPNVPTNCTWRHCYHGLVWLIMQQINYYTAASAIYQISALYDVGGWGQLGLRALTSYSTNIWYSCYIDSLTNCTNII